MNNNRSNRRRGRGNRNQSGGNQGNRIDSRARGNAPQLLEKYKKLAQDAQHNGDRVQAEYYLQFADHYFRVIADNKARQDEGRTRRDDRDQDDGEDEDETENRHRDSGSGRRQRSRRDDRDDRDEREDRDEPRNRGRSERDDGDEDSREGAEYEPAENPFTRKEEAERPRRRAPRKAPRAGTAADSEIDHAALPPAIGNRAAEGAKDKPAPRRRRKQEGDSELTAVG